MNERQRKYFIASKRQPSGIKSRLSTDLPLPRSQFKKFTAIDNRRWFKFALDRLRDNFDSQPPTEKEDAWAPSYLEYQFAVSAPEDESGETRRH
jgi:hypothetical protein